MLHLQYSDTKANTVHSIVCAHRVCLREQFYLHGLQQAERQAWLKKLWVLVVGGPVERSLTPIVDEVWRSRRTYCLIIHKG